MKDFKKRKYIIASAIIGTILLIGWVIFLIWYLGSIPERLTTAEREQQIDATEQGKSDQYFSEIEKRFTDSHPWYEELPKSTEKYFLFYHPIDDVFIADIYLPADSPASEVDQIKSEVNDYLTSIGVNTKTSKLLWSFIKSPNLEP